MRSPRSPASSSRTAGSGAKWDEGQPNYAALLEWNNSPVDAKSVAAFADQLAQLAP